MKILVAHTFYQQPGGEDTVFAAEVELLRNAGHDVTTYTRSNEEIEAYSLSKKLLLLPNTVWSRGSKQEFAAVLDREQPSIVHFHNTFPLMSPAVYAACKERDIAVVQTLHNFRLICPSATLFRQGSPCEECIGGIPWPSILHGCYRESRVATAAVAAMITFNLALETWTHLVDRFIVCSQFARDKFVQGGLPPEKLKVKPNFVAPDPGIRTDRDNYAIYVGRLAEEKGLSTLLSAWRDIGDTLALHIIGDGPLRSALQQQCRERAISNVHFHGRLPRQTALEHLRRARFLVFPSECYEGFPMAITEAFASGVPVIASRIGSTGEIVNNGLNGLTFCAGSATSLSAQVQWALAHADRIDEMGLAGRHDFEQKYSAPENYRVLINIYNSAMTAKAASEVHYGASTAEAA
jgi:glycosyltransferase involved in cell wall biosynthesis